MVLVAQVRDLRVYHKVHQVHKVRHLISQHQEALHELLLEFLVVFAANASHWLDHILRNSDFGGQSLLCSIWFFSEDEAEVDMEELSILGDHQVFQMSVSYS